MFNLLNIISSSGRKIEKSGKNNIIVSWNDLKNEGCNLGFRTMLQ
jgi:hypothetical protein